MKFIQALKGALVITALGLSTAGATTYYVSPTGNDGSAGTTASQAWKTLARVNQAPLQGGDSVLLQRGGVWHEQIAVRGGRAGAPVTYGAYGTAASLPVIDGADVLTGVRKIGTDTYRAPLKGTVGKVFIGASYLVEQVPLKQASSSAESLSTAGTFFSDGDSLLVHTAPQKGDVPVLEVSTPTRRYAMENRGQMYVVVQDLAMVRTYNSAFVSRPTMSNKGSQHLEGSNITVQRCQFVNYGSPSDYRYNDYAEDAGEGAIYIAGFHDSANQEQPLPNINVLENKVGRYDSHGTIDYDRAGILIRNTTGAVIRGNMVATQTAMGLRVADNYNNAQNDTAQISFNVMTENQGNISIAGCIGCRVVMNWIQNSSGFGIGIGKGMIATSDKPEFIGNVILQLRPSADGTLYNGVDCNAGTKRGVARGNMISAVANYSFTLEADNGQGCTGWTLEQNTFDARANVTYLGKSAGRMGCLYVQAPAQTGLAMRGNRMVANASYPRCVAYGADSMTDTTHDRTPSEVPQ